MKAPKIFEEKSSPVINSILDCIYGAYPEALTTQEIADQVGIGAADVRPRMQRLVRTGLVRVAGERRAHSFGRGWKLYVAGYMPTPDADASPVTEKA